MIQSKIISFVATQNPAGARKFYRETLGLTLVSEDAFALAFEASGTMLRVQIVQELRPAGHTVLGWNVPDIQAEINALAQKGVRFEHFSGLGQDASGIWKAPSGAQVAWFKDPDGNMLSLTQFHT